MSLVHDEQPGIPRIPDLDMTLSYIFDTNSIVVSTSSIADPNLDPNPPDPHVFGPPGSGSISQTFL